jgi:hypothetical protein
MDCGGVLDIRSSIRYLDHFYSYPLMPSMTRSGVLQSIVGLFSHPSICSLVNISLAHIWDPAAMHFSSTLVAMPRSSSDTWNRSSVVKYAVIINVGSHTALYPVMRYSCFWAVVILMAVFVRRWTIIVRTVSSPKPMYCFFSGASASSPTA